MKNSNILLTKSAIQIIFFSLEILCSGAWKKGLAITIFKKSPPAASSAPPASRPPGDRRLAKMHLWVFMAEAMPASAKYPGYVTVLNVG